MNDHCYVGVTVIKRNFLVFGQGKIFWLDHFHYCKGLDIMSNRRVWSRFFYTKHGDFKLLTLVGKMTNKLSMDMPFLSAKNIFKGSKNINKYLFELKKIICHVSSL